jgi:AraC-like DNA-binding protein
MIGKFRLSPLSIARLEAHGVSPEAVARGAGLPPSLLREQRVLLTTEQLFAFWRAVADVSGDPAIGLKLGSETRVERLDVVSLAALSAASFRDALTRAARYKQLTCPEEIRVTSRGGECAVRFRWLRARGEECDVLTDVCFAWVAALAHRGTAGAVRPVRVELSGAPRIRRLYEGHFGCPVRFDATSSALFFRAADLDRRFETHNADLLDTLTPQLDAELASRQESDDARDQVRAVLRRLMAGRRPELRDVARELASSPRTLQRRLGDLGVSYHQVLEQARRDLASRYLLDASLELAEIAYLLGYEDANSFVRAFSRWEGVPPGRWRENRREHRTSHDVAAHPLERHRDHRARRRGRRGMDPFASFSR